MPALLLRENKEGSVFLAVEGAQAFEIAPGFLQSNVLGDKLYYI
jgi:hypothetical protein